MSKQIQVPNLTAIIGEFGSGKSLYSLELGLYLANQYHKRFASNMVLDLEALVIYCRSQGFDWLADNAPFYYYGNLDPSTLLDFKNSIVICDEAGSLFHARFWQSTTKDFLIKLAQLRKLNIHLILTYQYVYQIDKVFREQTQHFVLCFADTRYDRKLKLPKLLCRSRYHFNRRRFEQYENDIAFRNHPIKPKLAAISYNLDFPPFAYILAEFCKCIMLPILASKRFTASQIRAKLLLMTDRFSLLFKCFDSSIAIAISSSDVVPLFQKLAKRQRVSAASSSPIPILIVRKVN
jgi:hypothetical protein